MSDQDDIKRLIINYQRRLQKLKEAQALQGVNTPPETLIQIEDIEAELEQLQTVLQTLSDDPHSESLHNGPNSVTAARPNLDRASTLVQQLLKALKEDPDFAAELAVLLNPKPTAPDAKSGSTTASGGGITIGGNVGGSIVFGNNNTIIGSNSQTEQE